MTRDRTSQALANLLHQAQTVQQATAPSGGRAGATISLRVGGRALQARCLMSIAPGPVVAMLTATGWVCLPVAATRLVGERQVEFRQRRGGVVPEPPLPFSVVLIVDASGSLTPEDLPSLFTALDLIKAQLVELGSFTSIGQVNQYIITKTSETDERYLRWYREFSLEALAGKVVAINFQDEAAPNYHNPSGTFRSDGFYASDLNAFESFIASESKSLLGAKLFIPREIGGGFPSGDEAGFVNFTAEIDSHLEYVFLSPASGGYPSPRLDSFTSEIDTQMLEYEILIARDEFTVEYSYNIMADYLNVFFAALDFATLPPFSALP